MIIASIEQLTEIPQSISHCICSPKFYHRNMHNEMFSGIEFIVDIWCPEDGILLLTNEEIQNMKTSMRLQIKER